MTRRMLCSLVVLAMLAGIATTLTSAPAEAATNGVTVAGGHGSGSAANQLAGPSGVALDGGGSVYVADPGNARVQRWAPGATVGVTVAGGTGPGSAASQLDYPFGVTVDGSGNVYVADAFNSRVQRWAPGATAGVTVAGNGFQGSDPDRLNNPDGVAVDTAGNVYVADNSNNRVQRWAPGATVGVTVAGGNGAGADPDQLWGPVAVAVDAAGNTYVTDNGNNRVQRWAPGATAGVTVAGNGFQGSAADQLGSPNGVAVDTVGNVYVSDTWNNRVQRWAPGATVGVTVAGGNGSGSADGQLAFPFGVTVDGSGNVYVADSGNDRVQRWSPGEVPPRMVPGVASVVEGNLGTTAVEVPVTLESASTQTVTALWNTLLVTGAPAGQADPLTDYVSASGTVSFAPGETSKTVTLHVNGDTLAEHAEYIVVSFHDPTNAVMGGFWGLGFGAITNDDRFNTTLTVTPDTGLTDRQSVTVTGAGFAPNARINVCEIAQNPGPVNTCEGPSVLVDASSSGTFATEFDVRQSIPFSLPPLGTVIYPCDGTATSLHLPCFISAWDTSASFESWVGVELDFRPEVLPGVASALEGDAGTAALQVPVRLSHSSTVTITVPWTTLTVPGGPGGQADPSGDYPPSSGTVTFAPGETAKTVTIPVNGDYQVEPDEYIVVSFHDPTGYCSYGPCRIVSMGGFWGLGFGVISNDD